MGRHGVGLGRTGSWTRASSGLLDRILLLLQYVQCFEFDPTPEVTLFLFGKGLLPVGDGAGMFAQPGPQRKLSANIVSLEATW